MKSVSIGYFREDKDFAILAALKDEGLTEKEFLALAEQIRVFLGITLEEEVVVLERDDTPDYVEVEDGQD